MGEGGGMGEGGSKGEREKTGAGERERDRKRENKGEISMQSWNSLTRIMCCGFFEVVPH